MGVRECVCVRACVCVCVCVRARARECVRVYGGANAVLAVLHDRDLYTYLNL